MANLVPVATHEEQAFTALLSKTNHERSEFKFELTEHSLATYGPRVKTIKIFWNDRVIAEYGAADATSWVDQFRADWDSGLIPEVLKDHEGMSKLAERYEP